MRYSPKIRRGRNLKIVGDSCETASRNLEFKDELNFKKCKHRDESKILKFQKRYKFKKTAAFD